MSRTDLTPNCAICGGPGEPECPHEGDRLKIAIDQAEKRWVDSWLARSREWVTNKAIAHVTAVFEQLKTRRRQLHQHNLRQLPYWDMFVQHRGRPPLDPNLVAHIHRQIAIADANLRRGIDEDWKLCVLRYPDVLAHFFSQIEVHHPQNAEGPALEGLSPVVAQAPTIPTIPPPQLLTQHAHPPSVIGTAFGGVTAPRPPPLMRSSTAPVREQALFAPPAAPMVPTAGTRRDKAERPKPKHSNSAANRTSGAFDPMDLINKLNDQTAAAKKATKKAARQSDHRNSLVMDEHVRAALMQMQMQQQQQQAHAPPQRANSVVANEPATRRKRRDSGQIHLGGLASMGGMAGALPNIGVSAAAGGGGWPGGHPGMDGRRGSYYGYDLD